MALDFTRFIKNGRGLNVLSMLTFTDGASPTPDPMVGQVLVVSLFLDQDLAIFLVNGIYVLI